MSLDRQLSFSSERRVSFAASLNYSEPEAIKLGSKIPKAKPSNQNDSKNSDTKADKENSVSETVKDGNEGFDRSHDEGSSSEDKASNQDSDSIHSQDVSFEKKRKKKWKIKLPWKKKSKRITESPPHSDSESSETEDEGQSIPQNVLSSVENVQKSPDFMRTRSKIGPKRSAASWYGFEPTHDEIKSDSVDGFTPEEDTKDTDELKNRPKYDFHYETTSESEAEIFPPSKPYHKRVREKTRKLLPDDEVSMSNPNLIEKDSNEKSKDENSSSESGSSKPEDTVASKKRNYSIKQQRSSKIKKSYSLPSIFFRRNKKKKEERRQSQREELIEDEQSTDSDSKRPPHDSNKSQEIKKKLKNNSAYVETPLASVGSEKPSLKSWSAKENIFEREYSNNVETVNSIFKRSSYKRVYGRNKASSVTYPPPKNQLEVKDSKTSENLHSGTLEGHSPITSWSKESKRSLGKRTVKEDKSSVPDKVEKAIKEKRSSSRTSTLTRNQSKESSRKDNSIRESKKKITEIKAEINNYPKEQDYKPSNEKTSPVRPILREIKHNQDSIKSLTEREKGKQGMKATPTDSQREEVFERTLERNLKAAKKIVDDVNNQFGQSIFTRNYRTSAASKVNPSSQNKENIKTSKNAESSQSPKETLIRRKSYEEMINLMEEQMFESDDESSDTDGDQIDLSFKKPHLDALVDFEIKCSSERQLKLRKTQSSDDASDSDGDQHIYHIRVIKNAEPAPADANKISPVLQRPSFAPPPPPVATITEQQLQLTDTQDSSTSKKKQDYFDSAGNTVNHLKRYESDNSSDGCSSSNQEDNEVIYANATVKQRKQTKAKEAKEINHLLDESIKRYVLLDSPPNFSPPPIIPEPKFSPGVNDRSFYNNVSRSLQGGVVNEVQTHSTNMNHVDNVSANCIAKQLLLQRDQQKQGFYEPPNSKILPIKNIKSFRSSDNLLPPPPPSLPPPEEDPFWSPHKQTETPPFIKSFHNRNLSISHGPTISYNPATEVRKVTVTEPLSTTARNTNINKKGTQAAFNVEFNEPQALTSPVLLKAELVDRGKKDNTVLNVRREFVGPYNVSPRQSTTDEDSRKQVVSFCVAPESVGTDESEENVEQIYANQPPFSINLPPKYASPSPTREEITQKQPPSIARLYEKMNEQEKKMILQNWKNQFNTYPYKKTEINNQQKPVDRQPVAEEIQNLPSVQNKNVSITQASGTPLNYNIVRMSHTEETLKTKASSANTPFNNTAKDYADHTIPKQRPPLKSILKNMNRTCYPLTVEKQMSTNIQTVAESPTKYSQPYFRQNLNEKNQSNSITSTIIKESEIERLKIDTSSSDSESPPSVPDYPPPPPRKMTEVQQIFIESLLHPSTLEQYSSTNTSHYKSHNTKTTLPTREPVFGNSLTRPRSRAPYIDFPASEFEPVSVTYSNLPPQQTARDKSQSYHRNQTGYASEFYRNHDYSDRMETSELKGTSEYSWNKSRDQILQEELIYENCFLKTDV